MSKLSIETTQNVDIEYEPATLGDRILAYLIDSFIVGAYITVIYVLLIMFIFSMEGAGVGRGLGETGVVVIMVIIFLVMILPPMFYHLVSEVWMQGQSFGKKAMNIKVIRLDGTQPTLKNYILRWILRPIDTLFYGIPAIISITNSEQNQRIGDKSAGTTVVKFKKKEKMTLQDVVESQIEVENSIYEPTYFQVTMLNAKDVTIIEEVLENYYKTKDGKVVNNLADKVKDTLQIQSEQASVPLLETVVKDYNYLTKN